MPSKMYLGLYNAINSIVFKTATTEATTEAQNIITKNDRLSKFLESSNNTIGISSYIMDILYIFIVLVIAVAFLTLLAHIYKYMKQKRDPHYKRNDDDFLDN